MTSIVNAFEEEGMSPEEISETQGLEISSVKAGLMQFSSKYRKACGQQDESIDDGLNFNDDDMRRVNQVIRELALGAEDENLRFKAATYVRNDKKGRLEPAKALGGGQFNILFINEQLRKVRSVAEGLKSAVSSGNGQQKSISV
jgi:hypothetical protein